MQAVRRSGAPGKSRTCDLLVRSRGVLANLLKHKAASVGMSRHTVTQNHEVRDVSKCLVVQMWYERRGSLPDLAVSWN